MPLSQKQMEYLAIAWQCFETEPKIDYETFHKLAGLASANSARELMRVTKNKLREEYGALGGAIPATPKKGTAAGAGAKTPGSRKRATRGSVGASGKGKKGGKKDKDVSAEPGAGESGSGSVSEGEDGSPRKKAKKGGKGAVSEVGIAVRVKEEPKRDEDFGGDEFEEANHFM